MLLVAVTCTEEDFSINLERIEISLNNFYAIFGDDISFIFVYQSKKELIPEVEFFSGLPRELYEFVVVPYYSVSRARNEAADYALRNRYKHLVFHDSSIIFTEQYIGWLKSNLHEGLLSTKYAYTNDIKSHDMQTGSQTVSFHDFNNIFLCTYLFPLSAQIPRFNEQFGPGEDTHFNSGEDFLFIRRFFQLNPEFREFKRFNGVGILHPPRPKDYSKQLAYATGQGKIHQIYLREEKSFYALWRCVLFFGNAIFRVLMFKKNAIKILGLRLKGFFDKGGNI